MKAATTDTKGNKMSAKKLNVGGVEVTKTKCEDGFTRFECDGFRVGRDPFGRSEDWHVFKFNGNSWAMGGGFKTQREAVSRMTAYWRVAARA